jgi:thiosulfate dehydrogenase
MVAPIVSPANYLRMTRHIVSKLQWERPLMAAALVIVILALLLNVGKRVPANHAETKPVISDKASWHPPDTAGIPHTPQGDLIRYGRDLVANTSRFLGPNGIVAAMSNGMNCQNCHLEAGSRFFGNNYSAVFSTYPKFRARSGTIENIFKRVNDCFERSLNGHALDSNGHEMKAICAYISWLGKDVPKNSKPVGAGLPDLVFPERAADTGKGHLVYQQQCQRCHGSRGEGTPLKENTGYVYPPLWGPGSYTTAAGLYRISRFAAFVKDNMPFGSSHNAPQLTDEEAWDLAAFVNSQPRPQKKYKKDWPNPATKPVDFPFAPFSDSFSERQHKYGPFGPIARLHQATRP